MAEGINTYLVFAQIYKKLRYTGKFSLVSCTPLLTVL